VARDVALVAGLEPRLGLHLNPAKCEIILGSKAEIPLPFSGYIETQMDGLCLLGAPIFRGIALDATLEDHCRVLSRALERMIKLPSQNALILLRSSFGATKLSYLLRCSPCLGHPALTRLDDLLRQGLESIVNCSLNNYQWLQSTLPIKDGGLGIRRIVSLASSAYLASAAATLGLQTSILATRAAPSDDYVDEMMEFRKDTLPTTELPPAKQRTWDRPLIERDVAEICQHSEGLINKARLEAARSPHSADWLHVMPVEACGLALDNETVRIAVGLRLGLSLCGPHRCKCGEMVGEDGYHGFVCRRSQGRSLRHHAVNDILWRALTKAEIPSTREPTGLFRADGKRPDGATLVPWERGKYIAWDATIVHTCAASYITHQSGEGESAAVLAANRKTLKYEGLPSSFIFQPVAIETMGRYNPSALAFIGEIGRRTSAITGDRRETTFLFQRLSICIQRYNLVALKGTYPSTQEDEF